MCKILFKDYNEADDSCAGRELSWSCHGLEFGCR